MTHVDRSGKSVTVHDLTTGKIFKQEYEKLIMATGARAIRPNLPGMELSGIFTLKEFQDGLDLKRFMEHDKPTRGVIIGGGYIGLEISDAFGRLGMEVSVIEALPRIMTIMDEDMSKLVSDEMTRNRVKIITGKKVVGFRGSGSVEKVILDGGDSVDADCVVLSIGVAPNSELAAEAGLELGERNAIKVRPFSEDQRPGYLCCR